MSGFRVALECWEFFRYSKCIFVQSKCPMNPVEVRRRTRVHIVRGIPISRVTIFPNGFNEGPYILIFFKGF